MSSGESVIRAAQWLPPLPSAREFVLSAGFGGAAALLAALLLAGVVLFALRRASTRHRLELDQQERHNQQVRDAEQRNAAVQRCWQRLVWVVETAGIEPAASQGATVGLGPDLALELVRGLLREAEDLGDATLTAALTVYLNQFAQVLAQQGNVSGEPSNPASGEPAATDGPAPQDETPPKPQTRSTESTDSSAQAPTKVGVSAQPRRRRR